MSDRRKNNLLGAVLVVALIVLAAVGWQAYSHASDPFRAAVPLDLPAYETSANSLRGNTYKLKGEILTLLAWSPSGRIIAVGVENEKKSVPLLLPGDLSRVNIEKGQKFQFLLHVDDQGVLRVKKMAQS
jgi:hypothetical protein